jgi:hypothetical protein
MHFIVYKLLYIYKEPNKLRRKAALPNGEVINTVSVEASGNKYKVTLKPFNCGTGLPLFRLGHALVGTSFFLYFQFNLFPFE